MNLGLSRRAASVILSRRVVMASWLRASYLINSLHYEILTLIFFRFWLVFFLIFRIFFGGRLENLPCTWWSVPLSRYHILDDWEFLFWDHRWHSQGLPMRILFHSICYRNWQTFFWARSSSWLRKCWFFFAIQRLSPGIPNRFHMKSHWLFFWLHKYILLSNY